MPMPEVEQREREAERPLPLVLRHQPRELSVADADHSPMLRSP